MTTVDKPARGTRPANRRELILLAARDLFADQGYEHVAMSDVARAVSVGPSALYRHFDSKQRLLTAVLQFELSSLAAAVAASEGSPRERLRALACSAYGHRRAAALLQREARHLPAAERSAVREVASDLETAVLALTSEARPDLTASENELLNGALMAVLTAPAFTQLTLSRAGWDVLLSDVADRLLDTPALGWTDTAVRRASDGLLPRSRREALLTAALKLFAERTYASVGIEDVAAAAGMGGASVYSYFSSKQDILATALDRGGAVLAMDAAAALSSSTTPSEALRQLVERYTRFALAHHDLVDVLITELRSLDEPVRTVMLDAQREYVAEWAHLLTQIHPTVPTPVARVQVHLALMLINAVARSDRLRAAEGTQSSLLVLANRVLEV